MKDLKIENNPFNNFNNIYSLDNNRLLPKSHSFNGENPQIKKKPL